MGEIVRKAFVIGHPIAHSRSPLIHGHWLSRLGLNGSYERIDVAPADLPVFLNDMALNGFVGGNVTIPHKEVVHDLVTRRTDAADLIGAVNTLWFADGILHGDNTDAHGFAANLDQYQPGWNSASSALVLGAGGAARAILFALIEKGVRDIRIVNRTLARAQELADRFGESVSAHAWDEMDGLVTDVELVVNTTSVGMGGQGASPLNVSLLSADALVTDIVYTPLQTPLLSAAAARGLRTVDGLGMLLHQAAPGFGRWFGNLPPVTDELRDIIVADLGAHA